jgi:RNA polymerase sigma factor (sigma-70 family)
MRPLDGDRRALAAAHVHLIALVARSSRNRYLDRDERASAAALALCRAAAEWPGIGDFKAYAVVAALRQIHRDARAIRRRPTTVLRGPIVCRKSRWAEELADIRDEAAHVRKYMGRLSDRERLILEAEAAGVDRRQLADDLGILPRSSDRIKRKAIARLRAELCP